MGDLVFFRRPAPRALRDEVQASTPARPAPPKPAAAAALPTRWKPMPYGADHVENPNVCLICHKARHPNRPHHDFEPDVAPLAIARRLGWAIPSNQEPLT